MTAEPTGTLADRLGRHVDRFDPFEALRLAEAARAPGEPLPVRGALTNRFLPTALRASPRTGEIETAFVGLVGPLGPLPPFYTETVLREEKRRSTGLGAFLDVFLKRVTGLFVRTHEKYRLPPLIERVGIGGTSAVTGALYALIGLGSPSLRNRLATADSRLLPYAGLLIPEVRSAAGLAVILAEELAIPVRVQPLSPRWLPIEDHEQSRLDDARQYCRLGIDAVAGARTLDVASTFRVVLGPVDYGTFKWLMPGSPTMTRLVELVRFYADPGLDFDVQVVLRKDSVPESQLGSTPPRLGWDSWLRELPALHDADQAIFDPAST